MATVDSASSQQARKSHGGSKTSPPTSVKVREKRSRPTVMGDKLSTLNDQGANGLQK